MASEPKPDKLATLVAEEILRAIYGDDFQGCTVSLDTIAALISDALKQNTERERNVIEMYEKVVEALHLLSTPPDPSKVGGPDELRSLLGERLDTIRTLTGKTIETTKRLKATAGEND